MSVCWGGSWTKSFEFLVARMSWHISWSKEIRDIVCRHLFHRLWDAYLWLLMFYFEFYLNKWSMLDGSNNSTPKIQQQHYWLDLISPLCSSSSPHCAPPCNCPATCDSSIPLGKGESEGESGDRRTIFYDPCKRPDVREIRAARVRWRIIKWEWILN